MNDTVTQVVHFKYQALLTVGLVEPDIDQFGSNHCPAVHHIHKCSNNQECRNWQYLRSIEITFIFASAVVNRTMNTNPEYQVRDWAPRNCNLVGVENLERE